MLSIFSALLRKVSYKLEYNYDKEAIAPNFLKVLHHALNNDKAMIKRFLEHIGNIFVDRSIVNKELIPVLKGGGSNSKSTILNAIISMLGEENVSYVQAHEIGEEYKTAMMKNKLLNIGSDSDASIKTSALKSIASGEKIYAREVFSKGEFITPPKMFFAINNDFYSRNGDSSFGFTRRLDYFPFEVRITADMIDPNLEQKLYNERSGILNLALVNALDLIKNKNFTYSKRLADANKEVVHNINKEARYAKESLEADINERLTNAQIYNDYTSWCKNEGVKPTSKNQLLMSLKSQGFVAYKNNGTRGLKAKFQENINTPFSNLRINNTSANNIEEQVS